MEKLWAGRLESGIDQAANELNASIRFDFRMVEQDIEGSIAHATMLAAQKIITGEDWEAISSGLRAILNDLKSGALSVDMSSEDVHTFVEAELTRRIGDAGKRLHTARSRNDQVALDLRMYLRQQAGELKGLTEEAVRVLCGRAEELADAILPGYTHMQRAQPVTFGHHLMAYAMMLMRDLERMRDCLKRMDALPLGCCALAGTTYPLDRPLTALLLGFDRLSLNSMDGVSDRDFVIELASCLSIEMMHLSRLAEEIVLWSSWEFQFIELDDAFSTGSSIMPQKKNPDMAELIRGKTGRVYGNLMALLTVLKGLPLAYNKDMQEDKEAVFDSVDTLKQCLTVLAPMLKTMRPRRDKMRAAASAGFINATDCADYLTKKGVPFRTAYQVTGKLVAYCIERGRTLESLPLAEYQTFHPLFENDVYAAIDLDACVSRRTSLGGPSPDSVLSQAETVRHALECGNYAVGAPAKE